MYHKLASEHSNRVTEGEAKEEEAEKKTAVVAEARAEVALGKCNSTTI